MSGSISSALVVVVVAVALFGDIVVGGIHVAELTLAAGVAGAAILLAATRPGGAIGALVFYVPLQQTMLAWVYAKGLPLTLVKDFGYIKDALVLGVCIAAVRNVQQRRVALRLDAFDGFAILYVTIALVYLVLPSVFHGALGGQSFTTRIDAWRLDCLFPILALAGRRTPLSEASIRRIRYVVFLVAAAMFAVAVWESVDKLNYNHFLVSTIHLPEYQQQALKTLPPINDDYIITSVIGGLTVVRVGGLLADPLGLGFYMVLPLALAIERISSSRAQRLTVLVAVASGVTVALTETRSAMIAGGLAIGLGSYVAYRKGSEARGRLAVFTIVALLVAVPLTAHTAFSSRLASAFSGTSQNVDNQTHAQRSESAYHLVLHHPAGEGLGANPATGARDQTSNSVKSENSYLQVGTELGIAGMLAFVAMYLALLYKLRWRSRFHDEAGGLAGASWLAGMGLFVGGFFLHVWINYPVSLTYWGLAGISLAVPPPAPSPQPAAALPGQRLRARALAEGIW